VSELKRSPSGRKLQLRARAIRQSETRESITQATVELHEQLGPLHTTITAIAARAGVERLTVYRHFPDEASLLQACQQHFFAAHPLPDLSVWREISPFPKRLEVSLTDLYEYWEQTHAMFSSVLRDYEVDPEKTGVGIVTFMSHARDALLDGQDVSGHRGHTLRAVVGHAVHFYTWRSLVRDQGLSNAEATKLMCQTITLTATWQNPSG
jgi:AcrR family transcriptional regulator